jgi:membrane peptidoglycan carboxypeptidase
VAQLYTGLAAGGVARTPIFVKRILDRDDRSIDESASDERTVLDPGPAYLVSSALADAPLLYSDGQPVLDSGARLAAHVALSDDGRDGWVAGYLPNLVVVVWIGSTGKPLRNLDPALRMWGDVVGAAIKTRPSDDFAAPPDVVPLALCKNAGCSSRYTELVLSGTEATAQAANAASMAAPRRAEVSSRTPLIHRDVSTVSDVGSSQGVAAGNTAVARTGPVTVPNVSGTLPDQARERLIAAGLRVAATLRYVTAAEIPKTSRDVVVGQVVSTLPAAGGQVAPNSEVTLVVRRS